MRKTLLCAIAIFTLGVNLSAQEPAMSLGLGLEWDMNSRENFAGGAALGFDYNFLQSFAAGLTVTASSNFNGITVMEPVAMFRWYFLGKGHSGLFAQVDAGVYLVLEDGDLTSLFDGGLRAGIRLPFGRRFYVEPYGRAGYPFAFGIGVMTGIQIAKKNDQ
jgi:hypothetical protein